MHLTLRVLLQALPALGALSSVAFCVLSGFGFVSFLGDRRTKRKRAALPENQLPPVSILKPLKGIDPGIWESLCSHCEQEYPEFQLIFGVSDPVDPSIDLVHRLQKKYPEREIVLVMCERDLGANTKVSNLAQMLP